MEQPWRYTWSILSTPGLTCQSLYPGVCPRTLPGKVPAHLPFHNQKAEEQPQLSQSLHNTTGGHPHPTSQRYRPRPGGFCEDRSAHTPRPSSSQSPGTPVKSSFERPQSSYLPGATDSPEKGPAPMAPSPPTDAPRLGNRAPSLACLPSSEPTQECQADPLVQNLLVSQRRLGSLPPGL